MHDACWPTRSRAHLPRLACRGQEAVEYAASCEEEAEDEDDPARRLPKALLKHKTQNLPVYLAPSAAVAVS